MENVKEYKTCIGIGPDALDKAVTTAIKDGFQPFGDPYYGSYGNDSGYFCQAMVKRNIQWRPASTRPKVA